VQGGSGLAQRVQVLNALRISKLDLHHLAPWGASNYEPPAVPGPRCQAALTTRLRLRACDQTKRQSAAAVPRQRGLALNRNKTRHSRVL
jgi:hypothetical protein